MMDEKRETGETGLNADGRKRILQIVLSTAVAAGLFLVSAGTLSVPGYWIYLGISLLSLILGAGYVLKRNPQAINERGRPSRGQPLWDKIIILIYTLFSLALYVLAGLDARFGWSSVPVVLRAAGGVILSLTAALTYAAMTHNRFLSMYVQVSESRGHEVETGGPYKFVRHPMYLGLLFSWPSTALLLGSWPALFCGLAGSFLILLRTALEDRHLQKHLKGYREYAGRVRFRIIPGIW